ncbi:hypothetical protein ACI2L4_09845 [Streptomyces sparsogenes]|uniref:hypothetical protein n=1 Tax=Streptomyces sparsogenes TaxID=67365 RepID=UPI00384BFB5A
MVRRQNSETIRKNAAWLTRKLDIAARRVLLTGRHAVSVRHFELLAAEMGLVRPLVDRTQALAPDATAADANVIEVEANAWSRRVAGPAGGVPR